MATTTIPRNPPAAGVVDVRELTKSKRLEQVFDRIEERRYPEVLAQFLESGDLAPATRNQVQDALWAGQGWPEVTARTRREVAVALQPVATFGLNPDGFMGLLHERWVLHTEVELLMGGGGLAAEIERHVLRNPEDWDVIELFRQLGALTSSDRRFVLFLQGLLSGTVTPDEDRQRAMADAITSALARDGLQVVETGTAGGYPDFPSFDRHASSTATADRFRIHHGQAGPAGTRRARPTDRGDEQSR